MCAHINSVIRAHRIRCMSWFGRRTSPLFCPYDGCFCTLAMRRRPISDLAGHPIDPLNQVATGTLRSSAHYLAKPRFSSSQPAYACHEFDSRCFKALLNIGATASKSLFDERRVSTCASVRLLAINPGQELRSTRERRRGRRRCQARGLCEPAAVHSAPRRSS